MRLWKIILSVVGALAILLAVLFATPILGPQTPDSVQAQGPTINGGAGVKEFYLYVNQNVYTGYGSVTNDCDSLNFSITPFCAITRIHVEIMQSAPSSGNCPVAPGSFMYQIEFASPQVSPFTFELPGDATNVNPPAFNPGSWTSPVYLTVHADIACGVYTGTAYAASCDPWTVWDCYTWPCANWAYYFPYTIVACP